jgi:hypothetical protein
VAMLPASVDYTDRDFDSLRARLIALVKSVLPPRTRAFIDFVHPRLAQAFADAFAA